ncbi:MAG TPA: hypothetical protein VH684_10010 [Xanthobacteraceae bacterium]|jgi:hypothetical protein
MMPLSRVRSSAAFITSLPNSNFLRLVASDDPDDGSQPKDSPSDRHAMARDDLPYKIELWNEPGSAVEQLIAVTANASIGYAAYYAATREYPDRHITLRHKNSVVARWRGPRH